ncbi:MAG: aminotransferase class V-fold PLP-dependent enzyme [Armatimonadetes bacterium]|nr:aminotransferase class V-fold PLP-dependent enzyme [Armatimonadota bacterium]
MLQLPDTEGMPNRVVLQKGHTVNYGQPITQAVRLAGARPVEAGSVNSCSEAELVHALRTPGAAALLAVESHHTVRHGYVPLPRAVELAHQAGVPVIVDGAAQDLRLRELIGLGCDLVITSAHKYLCSTTGGVVAGRSELVRAVLLQNRGIGRGMKAGKEAILGAVAALEYRAGQDLEGWTAEQDRKVARILALLEGIPGLQLSVDPDPNGCPFSRARLTLDEHPSHTAVSLARALAEGDPAVVPRAHHAVEGYLHLDAIEMTEAELEYACARVRRLLT